MIRIIDFNNVSKIGDKRVSLEAMAKDITGAIINDLAMDIQKGAVKKDTFEEFRDYAIFTQERAIAELKFLSLLFSFIFDKGELDEFINERVAKLEKTLLDIKEVGDNGKH